MPDQFKVGLYTFP